MYGHGDVSELSMRILQRANEEGVRCSVLTKGILPEQLADLPLENEYGITVVSLADNFIQEYEPGAAPVRDRIAALQRLSEAGKQTWVSIEPYPTPNIFEQDLGEILHAVAFTDRIIFGRLHYNKLVSEFSNQKLFYNRCAEQVIRFCQERNIRYHIKKGTQTTEEEHKTALD